ncbi:MAG: hypothetical protein K2P19_09830 [Kineothrix sp.]|nr:hypothetical protein [Kineothrix sp.]
MKRKEWKYERGDIYEEQGNMERKGNGTKKEYRDKKQRGWRNEYEKQ